MTSNNPFLRPLIFGALVACQFLLIGCFEPSGEYFVPKDPPAFEDIEINLDDDLTSLYVFRPVKIAYRVEQGDYQLIKIEGFLGDKSIGVPDDPTVLRIDPALFTQGTHVLSILATFISYSGTLASAHNMETKTIKREVDVTIDLEPPSPISIEKIQPRDGSLYVTWREPNKANFSNYSVVRFIKQNDDWVKVYMPEPWLVPAYKTEINDSLYLGGHVRYRIDIIGYNFEKEGNSADAMFQTINPQVEKLSDNQVSISWEPSLFQANIEHLVLNGGSNSNSVNSDVNVSLVRDVPFGTFSVLEVRPVAKFQSASYASQLIEYFSGERLFFDGEKPGLGTYLYPYGEDGLLPSSTSNTQTLKLVNLITGEGKNIVNLTPYYENAAIKWAAERSYFGSTPNGESFFLFTGAEVIRFDKNINFAESLVMPDLVPGATVFFSYNFRFSNNRIAFFNFFPGTVRLIDFNTSTSIAISLPDSGGPFNISPDGVHAFYNQKLFDISSGSMVELADFTSGRTLRDVIFNNESDKLYMCYSDGHFAVVDIASMSVVSENNLPGVIGIQRLVIDPKTGICGIVRDDDLNNGKLFVVFDPLNFTVIKEVRIASGCFILDNNIYSSSGYKLPL